MGHPKLQIAALPECPASYSHASIAELYANFEAKLENTYVVDPRGHKVFFRADNFPHLVKLEFLNHRTTSWVDAVANRVIAQLKSGNFDESRYRIADLSRSRTLFWLPDVLSRPDSIHENKRGNGNEVYLKRFRRKGEGATIKIALVTTRATGEKVIVTSFWTNDRYVEASVKMPPKHR